MKNIKSKKELIIGWSIISSSIIMLFWTGYYLINHQVPAVASVVLIDFRSTLISIPVSRWWDFLNGPIWAVILVYIFTREYTRNMLRATTDRIRIDYQMDRAPLCIPRLIGCMLIGAFITTKGIFVGHFSIATILGVNLFISVALPLAIIIIEALTRPIGLPVFLFPEFLQLFLGINLAGVIGVCLGVGPISTLLLVFTCFLIWLAIRAIRLFCLATKGLWDNFWVTISYIEKKSS